MATIRVRCEARDPCHAPQISYPIPRADRFFPTFASSPHHLCASVCARRENCKMCVDHPPTSSVSHTFPCSRRRCLPLTAMSGKSILVAATRCRHIIIATTRSACGGQVPYHRSPSPIAHPISPRHSEWRNRSCVAGRAASAVLRPMQILTIARAAQLLVVRHVVCVCVCVFVCVCVCVRVCVCE